MAFGIGMVLAPGFTRQFFSMLIYSTPNHIETFGAGTVAYVSLAHAVLGAVMFGWGVALLFIVLRPFHRGSWEAWQTLTISVTAWFIPDTAFSLLSGFWQNAVLNLAFAVLFAAPLAATYRECRDACT
jgi:hypothetical protein